MQPGRVCLLRKTLPTLQRSWKRALWRIEIKQHNGRFVSRPFSPISGPVLHLHLFGAVSFGWNHRKCFGCGDTALHWAAYKGHADLIRLLMYSGVDLQKTDNFGSTPLHLACLSGNLQCVKILCEKRNLELEPRDKNGKTPVMLAQSHRNSEVVKLLHNEMKKKSRWMPPISEIWGMLFGGAGASKGPLILFLVSVLLWGYPMYMIRVSERYCVVTVDLCN